MTDSQSLLADYVQNQSESAFDAIVTRYLDLVYSSAFRLLDGDAHRAKDVAQIVFADLARKAGELSPNVMLGGWLHRHTCFVALNLQRSERRRLAREREAVEMKSLHEDVSSNFSSVSPLLDESINQLADADRTAILLRFFEQKDFHTVGQSLDTSEDAARMRVNRALDKLRELLAQRGIQTTAATLGIIISTNAVQAAPLGLVASISTTALAGTVVSSATVVAATTNTIAMTAIQKTVVTATIAVLAGVSIYESRQASKRDDQIRATQQLLSSQTEQFQQLQADFSIATNRLADLLVQNSRLKSDSNQNELLKLRGELSRLKSEAVNETASVAGAWLDKVNRLKQRLQTDTQARIPEMQFLTDNDWLKAASGKLKTEADFRRAMAVLRNSAEMHFGSRLQGPLKEYVKANTEVPTDMGQFRPYFSEPIDETVLQRWRITSGSKGPVQVTGSDWVVTQKSAVDDVFDTSISITARGIGSTDVFFSRSNQKVLGPVYEAFAAANPNHGEDAPQASKLLPFATTPEQQAVVEKLILRQDAYGMKTPTP